MLTVNTNLSSINGQRHLENSTSLHSTSMTRLSSGLKVNSAKDDAAGLAIASGMASQIGGMSVAVRNAYDGISLVQTAEGSLNAIGDTLQRMRELALQSASSATISPSDRGMLQTEFGALNDELTRIVQSSEFNGKKVLNGDLAVGLTVQVGANSDTDSRITISIANMANVLKPVTDSGLTPNKNILDSTLSSIISDAVSATSTNPQLLAANGAAKLANAAVAAAQLAAESPLDTALAKAASRANLEAVTALSRVSSAVLGDASANNAASLVTGDFVDSVAVANEANLAAATAVATTDDIIQNIIETDSDNAASLLNTASELASKTMEQILFAGKNVYASTTSSVTASILNAFNVGATQDIASFDNLSAIEQDKAQQAIALASVDIAKAIAGGSYVDDVTKSQQENEGDKRNFIQNHFLVSETTQVLNNFGNDYALSAIDMIDAAINSVDEQRAVLGGIYNPFMTAISNLQNGIENQSAAKSRIIDADFAQETANLSRAQILQQAGTAMLAQANQSPELVGSLLK